MATAFLNRYTDLPALIHILRSKRITLLNPQTWDDRNDSFFMSEYKARSKAKTLLALCFTERRETYHHWRVFSHGSNGVCIEFDKRKLLTAFKADARIKYGSVEYATLARMKSRPIKLEELPFLKRYAFMDEGEFRIIYSDAAKEIQFLECDIELSWIKKISLSPWMPKALFEASKSTLKEIPGCAKLVIASSTLIDNEKWKDLAARAG